MRRTLLPFVFFTCALAASAQTDRLRFDAPIVTKTFEGTGEDVATVNRVLNPGPRPVRARWIREITELPVGWALAVSDGTHENSARVDSADFVIPAYGSAPLTPHVIPNAIPGNAQVTIKVVDLQNRRNQAMATFRFEQVTTARLSRNVRLYPNPGDDEFKIASDVALSQVRLTNTLGMVVKTFPGNLQSYDVSDLPNGVYLVGMIGTDGRVVKTLRFSKRSIRT